MFQQLVISKSTSKRERHSHNSVISFTLNRPIVLCGIGVYGRTNPDELEEVTMTLYDSKHNILEQSKHQISNDGTPKTYQLLFENEIQLDSNIRYSIDVDGYEVYGRYYSVDEFYSDLEMNGVRLENTEFSMTLNINSIYFKT